MWIWSCIKTELQSPTSSCSRILNEFIQSIHYALELHIFGILWLKYVKLSLPRPNWMWNENQINSFVESIMCQAIWLVTATYIMKRILTFSGELMKELYHHLFIEVKDIASKCPVLRKQSRNIWVICHKSMVQEPLTWNKETEHQNLK